VKGMKLCTDRRSALFDLPCSVEQKIKELENTIDDKRIRFTFPTELPDLIQPEVARPERRWGGRPNGRSSGRALGRAGFRGRR